MGETPMLLVGPFLSRCLTGTRPANLVDEVTKTSYLASCQTIDDLRLDLLVSMDDEITKTYQFGILIGMNIPCRQAVGRATP
jgi:hypothetical protein